MVRRVLTDAQWAVMAPFCLGKPADPGRTGPDGRAFLEAVLWIARTGSPWRDLPDECGAICPMSSASGTRSTGVLRKWRDKGVFVRMFEALSGGDMDTEYVMIDATIVDVHRHAQGAKGGLSVRPLGAPRAV